MCDAGAHVSHVCRAWPLGVAFAHAAGAQQVRSTFFVLDSSVFRIADTAVWGRCADLWRAVSVVGVTVLDGHQWFLRRCSDCPRAPAPAGACRARLAFPSPHSCCAQSVSTRPRGAAAVSCRAVPLSRQPHTEAGGFWCCSAHQGSALCTLKRCAAHAHPRAACALAMCAQRWAHRCVFCAQLVAPAAPALAATPCLKRNAAPATKAHPYVRTAPALACNCVYAHLALVCALELLRTSTQCQAVEKRPQQLGRSERSASKLLQVLLTYYIFSTLSLPSVFGCFELSRRGAQERLRALGAPG